MSFHEWSSRSSDHYNNTIRLGFIANLVISMDCNLNINTFRSFYMKSFFLTKLKSSKKRFGSQFHILESLSPIVSTLSTIYTKVFTSRHFHVFFSPNFDRYYKKISFIHMLAVTFVCFVVVQPARSQWQSLNIRKNSKIIHLCD